MFIFSLVTSHIHLKNKIKKHISCLCFRAEIALTDGRLMGIGRELNTTATEEKALKSTLEDLEKELRDINTTVAQKQHLLDNYLSSGFSGKNLNHLSLKNTIHVGT